MSSSSRTWEVIPAKDLAIPSSWKMDGSRYSAIRARLLIVRHELDEYRDGNVKESHPVSVDGITLETAQQRITVFTDTMTAGLRFAASQRVLDQLSTKITAELGAKSPGFSGKLGTELLAKKEYEFTATTEKNLSGTKSFQLTQSEERTHTIMLNPGVAREAQLRLRYWPRRWDVYLHSYEAIEFEHKKRWFWQDVRKTMKIAEPEILGWPLFSMSYYEPQNSPVVTYGAVANELIEPDEVSVSPLTVAMPTVIAPELPSLSELAKLAFPVTKQERSRSQVYLTAREKEAANIGRGRGLLDAGGRRYATKEAAAKKAAKKALKKATAKKGAKKVKKAAAKTAKSADRRVPAKKGAKTARRPRI